MLAVPLHRDKNHRRLGSEPIITTGNETAQVAATLVTLSAASLHMDYASRRKLA